jgi:hypothetical protein
LIVFDEFVALYQIEEISWRRDSLTRISVAPLGDCPRKMG